jgi:hypothetical protein
MNLHRTIDNLYIRLIGDFDGSSAFELINAIKENLNNSKCILIRFVGPNALYIAPT